MRALCAKVFGRSRCIRVHACSRVGTPVCTLNACLRACLVVCAHACLCARVRVGVPHPVSAPCAMHLYFGSGVCVYACASAFNLACVFCVSHTREFAWEQRMLCVRLFVGVAFSVCAFIVRTTFRCLFSSSACAFVLLVECQSRAAVPGREVCR